MKQTKQTNNRERWKNGKMKQIWGAKRAKTNLPRNGCYDFAKLAGVRTFYVLDNAIGGHYASNILRKQDTRSGARAGFVTTSPACTTRLRKRRIHMGE